MDQLIKKAIDSIPPDVVPVITENDVEAILSATKKGRLPVFVLSSKLVPSAVIINVAAFMKSKADVFFLGAPSESFLSRIGNPALPTVLAMFPRIDAEKMEYQIAIQNPSMFGPVGFVNTVRFIETIYLQSDPARENTAQDNQANNGSITYTNLVMLIVIILF